MNFLRIESKKLRKINFAIYTLPFLLNPLSKYAYSMQDIRQQNLLRQLVEFRTNQLISIIANPKAAVGSVSFDSCQSKFNVGKKQKAFPSLPFERGPRVLLISNYFVAAFNFLLPSEFLFCPFLTCYCSDYCSN